jgi:hypothetical protein
MKKIILLLVTGIISCWILSVSAQTLVSYPENFDGDSNTFTSSPASAWKIDTNYYVSSHNSIRGVVPNMVGDETILTSPVYDLTNYRYVLLRFRHICKVSPQDIVRIEYKISSQGWQSFPTESYYRGKAKIRAGGLYDFNADSYSEWQANDSLADPDQSWWKEETFNIGPDVGMDAEFQFRFVLKHGATPGTQISYGWLIDSIELIVAPYEITPPIVEFVSLWVNNELYSSLVKDTVYSSGPWKITAQVETTTAAPIIHPWLKYTATQHGDTIANDSILMTNLQDLIAGILDTWWWEATIPRFELGTEISYSLTGKDTNGNNSETITSSYLIASDHKYGDNSAALTDIIAPIKGQTTGNVTTPVEIMLRNKGDSALTSATIYWSVNGVITSYPWTGNLTWDYEEQVSLGTYTPRMEEYDTILIWISMPNGVQDIDLTDDTVSVITFGCSSTMAGTYTVGPGGVFPTMEEAVNTLKFCQTVGDITLAVQSGTYTENWNFSDSRDFMGNHALTITSAANNKDSVILNTPAGSSIYASSPAGITLLNSHNVRIANITIIVPRRRSAIVVGGTTFFTSGGYYMALPSSNIEITGCSILGEKKWLEGDLITVTLIVGSVSINNNVITGAYRGIVIDNIYDSITIIENNIIQDQGFGAILGASKLFKIVNNQITTGIYMESADWQGISVANGKGCITGNRITHTAPVGNVAGINVKGLVNDLILVSNNEIIMSGGGYSTLGIHFEQCWGIALHNSIYIPGSNLSYGIYYAGFNPVLHPTLQLHPSGINASFKNNNIIIESVSGYPIYINVDRDSAYWDMDYNNMYAPTYVGCTGGQITAGGNKTSIAAWQASVSSDKHSVSVHPGFINSNVNLKVSDYYHLRAPLLSEVDKDKENNVRSNPFTFMGCYHEVLPYTINATLGNISSLSTKAILGQQDNLQIALYNRGTTTLTTATIKWSVNGITQSTTGTWSGTLLSEQSTMITLGVINYAQAGDNIIKVWIDNLGTLQDEYAVDDTISTTIYVCSSSIGNMSVGATATFKTINEALRKLYTCGMDGDVTLNIQPGTYHEDINLSNLDNISNGYTLTLTSSTGLATDVIIKPLSTIAVTLSQSNNLIIKNITVDATTITNTNVINFRGVCKNVVIRDCRLLADTTTKVANLTGVGNIIYTAINGADSIFIIHNFMEGGANGVNFSRSNVWGIIIDSNTIQNNYVRGIYLFNGVKPVSISHNIILSRTVNTYYSWEGMSLQNITINEINGNKIIQRSNAITSLNGINFYDNRSGNPVISNNEIILNVGSGIYLRMSYAKVIHNSIYIGGTTAARGINIENNANNNIVVKNNNIVMEGTGAYPVYLNAVSNLNLYDIDNNNMYAPTYVGYAAGNKTSIAEWQQTIPTDTQSVSVSPSFIDKTQDLKLADTTGLSCRILSPWIHFDKDHRFRTIITTMGCYHGFPNTYSGNAELTYLSGNSEGLIMGKTDNIEAVLMNSGTTTLTNVTVKWTWNNQPQPDFVWNGSLPKATAIRVTLGAITHNTEGDYTIKAWISNLGQLTDEYAADDTVFATGYVCVPLSGRYETGIGGSDFTTIASFFDKLSKCGANGDITLEMLPGTYSGINLTNISNSLGGYSLTLTSTTHHAEDVIILSESANTAITLSNSNDIIIKDITVNVISGYGINFTGACTNVVIRDCRFLADTTTNTTTNPNSIIINGRIAGLDSIFIIHNFIDGTNTGIYFTSNGTTNMSKNIIIDSNTIQNNYTQAIDVSFINAISISHNVIMTRTATSPTVDNDSWTGILISNAHVDNVNRNKIIQRRNKITRPSGISFEIMEYYMRNFASYFSGKVLISNNEIILTSTYPYYSNFDGIRINGGRIEVIHNSIYIGGTAAARGINIPMNAYNDVVIKNNNIVMSAPDAYPVYINSTANLYDMDYNNMYAPTYVGYAGENKTTIADWQQTITTDKHSISILPAFIDSSVSLELSNYTGLSCLLYSEVLKDIKNSYRMGVTTMGAYNGIIASLDLEIEKIICNDTTVVYPQTIPVAIDVKNTGSYDKIDSAIFGWSINGEQQPFYRWQPANSLGINQNMEIPVGIFSAGKSATIDISVWVESVNGSKDSIPWNDTAKRSVQALCTGSNLSILSIEQLVPDGLLCAEDYTSLKIKVNNTGVLDYDFAANPVRFSIGVSNPEAYSFDTIISTGEIKSGETATLTLTDMFPIIAAGQYDIKVWIDSISNIVYDDTLLIYYISGKFGLPVDENFSHGIPIVFTSKGLNTSYTWEAISQGSDTTVSPQFGTGMLVFKGSRGSMTSLSTQRLDLSRTTLPALAFWYFHDTIPCEDYTDVRITVDGGLSYTTLLSLSKYDTVYGWKQYSLNLPPYAVNQCVYLVFEAMEKSRSEDVTQYIDRIRITAKRDIAVTAVLSSPLSACDMENKAWKVVLNNLTDPVLDYNTTPTAVTLEITGTGETFTQSLTSGSLAGFTSDTVTLSPSFNFAKGSCSVKAWFSSVLDDDRTNDTLVTTLVINPEISVQLTKVSASNACLAGELQLYQEVVLTNTGNMDLSDIELVLQIDTGQTGDPAYDVITEICTDTILAGKSLTYTFKEAYNVPWNADYYPRIYAALACNRGLIDTTIAITECVDMTDLFIVSIDNPSTTRDKVGEAIQVRASLHNRSDHETFAGLSITVLVTNSQGVEMAKFTEMTGSIGISATENHTFTNFYTVPNDTVYYLTVYINSYENYPQNDSMTITRYTDGVNITTLGTTNVFTLGQNIPNPATNSTRIDYSVPEAGEVIFHVHSITGQLLYSKTIEVAGGTHNIELNTSTFAAGVYFYSMEYKEQKLVRQLIIKN